MEFLVTQKEYRRLNRGHEPIDILFSNLRGKHLGDYLHDSPLKSWSRFTLGTL